MRDAELVRARRVQELSNANPQLAALALPPYLVRRPNMLTAGDGAGSGHCPILDATPSLRFSLGIDLLLLASILVLGGDFWDKIRALFIHEAKAQFPTER